MLPQGAGAPAGPSSFTLSTAGLTTGDEINLIPNVTRASGAVGGITVAANGDLNGNGTSSNGTTYTVPSLGSTTQYVEAVAAANGTASGGPLLMLWYTDASNWIGLRWVAGAMDIVTNIANTKATAATANYVVVTNDVIRFSIAAGVAKILVNGAQKGTDYAIVGVSPAQVGGLVTRSAAKVPWVKSGVTWVGV